MVIIATHHFIKRGEYADPVRVATSPLVHKPTGWMLHEMGKCDGAMLPAALQRRYRNRPPDKKALHE